jgi:hypothetical protein
MTPYIHSTAPTEYSRTILLLRHLEEFLLYNASNTDSVVAQNSMQHNLDVYATQVQHSPSATISVRPSTHTVWRIRSINPIHAPHQTHYNAMLQGKHFVSSETPVILVYQNTITLSVCSKRKPICISYTMICIGHIILFYLFYLGTYFKTNI